MLFRYLRLHGSVARGEASSNSDVDLIAEFEPGRRFTLIDMVKLESRLRELLGVKVDLSPANTLKEPVRRRAEREAVLAFWQRGQCSSRHCRRHRQHPAIYGRDGF